MTTTTARIILSPAILCLALATTVMSADGPQFPIGMNIGSLNYYSEVLMFNDVMTTASPWLTYHEGGGWDSGVRDQLELDENDYPVELPQMIDGHATMVRFLINTKYVGTYRFMYDGEGTFEWHIDHTEIDGKYYITLDGGGNNGWIQITSSMRGNHIRNMHLIPVELEDSFDRGNPEHLFNSQFIRGLEPWHALRFMDWTITNHSKQVHWSDRPTPTSYTQGAKGVCIDYAIDLCNYLEKDAWFCVPHAADDEYIRNFARLVRDSLTPGLKVYLEYSNELWNWIFQQAHWVGNNGTDQDRPELNAHDSITQQLEAVGQQYCGDATNYCHPEKDAHMIARTFNIWKSVFDETGRGDDLVRVAAIQVGWCANTSRILAYLDQHGGADAVSPTMYFNFTQEDHNLWNSMNPADVTPEMILEAVSQRMDDPEYYSCVQTTAEQARQYGLDIVVYEAGQHMQPWMQGEYDYNPALWEAQRHRGMYDLYMKYWGACDSIYQQAGGIKLNCAFAFVSERESKWGSWGHLESLDQLDSLDQMMEIAPKWQALLDMNAPLPVIGTLSPAQAVPAAAAVSTRLFVRNGRNPVLHVSLTQKRSIGVSVHDLSGRRLMKVPATSLTPGTHRLDLGRMSSAGIRLIRIEWKENGQVRRENRTVVLR